MKNKRCACVKGIVCFILVIVMLVSGMVALGAEKKNESEEYKFVKIPETSVTSVLSMRERGGGTDFVFDGDEGRGWHYAPEEKDGFPVILSVELDNAYTISALDYCAGVDGEGGAYGAWLDFDIWTSEDGDEWDLAYENLSFKSIKDVQRIYFEQPLKAKYIDFEIHCGTKGYTTCGEMVLYEKKEDVESDENGNYYNLVIGSDKIISAVNGSEKETVIDVAPFIDGGTTMIPLRGLLEIMGAEIGWDGATQKVMVKKGETEIELRIADKDVYVKSGEGEFKKYILTTPPIIKDGRTFIPLRFVTENLGYSVSWDGETQTITIMLKEAVKEEPEIKEEPESSTDKTEEIKTEPEKEEIEEYKETSSKKIGILIPTEEEWSIKYSSGKVTGNIRNAFDGKTASYWEASFTDGNGERKPIEITVDFGTVKKVSGFMFTPRQNGRADGILGYEVYASDDGTDFTSIASGSFQNTTGKGIEKRMASWGDVSLKAIKIIVIDSGKEKVSISEIEFFTGGEKGADIANYVGNCKQTSDVGDIFICITGLYLEVRDNRYYVYTDNDDRLKENGGFCDILKYLGFKKNGSDSKKEESGNKEAKMSIYEYSNDEISFSYMIKTSSGSKESDNYVYAELKFEGGLTGNLSSGASNNHSENTSSGSAGSKVKTEVQLGAPKYPIGIKSYTEITGREMKRYIKDGKDIIYVYEAGDSVADEVVEYLEYYEKKGWSFKWGEDYVNGEKVIYGVVSKYSSSGIKMIMVSIIFELDEVWVSVTTT